MKLLKILIAVFGFVSLAAADCCDWNGCTPEVRRIYGKDECPPHKDMVAGPPSHCIFNTLPPLDQLGKEYICKVRTEFGYFGEWPLGGTYSAGWKMYGSSQWMRFGFKWKEPIDLPDVPFSILREGISGGLSKASRGLAKVDHMDIELNDGQFGYFTFLPIKKSVCGTYSYAKPWPECDHNIGNEGNLCAVELSNYGETTGFWWFGSDVGEPTVRGHTVFVYTDSKGYRLPRDQQSDRYKIAMDDGVALNDDAYSGWRQVWQNPVLADKMQGGKYGPDDKDLFCFATDAALDKKVRDADVIHCAYAVGMLLRPHVAGHFIPNLKKWDEWAFPWERGCQIIVEYRMDWNKACKVSYAEVAAAASLINFNCMKETWLKGHTRFGVKGSHTLRSSGTFCHAEVHIWGGKGPGNVNIGSAEEVAAMDPKVQRILKWLPDGQAPNATFGDAYDPEWPETQYNESHPNY